MPSLSEAYRAHPVPVYHKHPDFDSLQELPESYTWTHLDDHAYPSNYSIKETVPVIDLNDPNASKLIGHACKTWGVFQIVNHGIPISLLDDIHGTGQTLFSLPSHQKLKAARSPDGVSGYGVARISSFFPKLMWSEGFTILGSPLEHFRQLWPQDYGKYCDIVVQYDETMKNLAGKLMWLMLDSLGITKDDIKWAGSNDQIKKACAALQLNSYPSCPDPDRAMGLAPHTDSTLLTILYQKNISGLQVQREGSGWVTVPPLPGGLVINVGDLLHILSNGLYPSVLHRVLVNRTRQRFSVAYLYGPPANVEIGPHAKLVGPSQPPVYRPVTWNEYLGTKAKHFNKALSWVRLCAPINGLFDVNESHEKSVHVG
ncbi:gibberellin 3-beta-dioxygenase 1-like [Gastrolobium bilobum]|uniref:gibberellin 3-beta-dioxygenase 1-like n=1 Tax=Gastrolobium bilobum TaxID=150636 RepID=UPI002AAF7A34|nr:gibberellin 3-beta-dioxygenase 1-like [Gastrolobium bilobum]